MRKNFSLVTLLMAVAIAILLSWYFTRAYYNQRLHTQASQSLKDSINQSEDFNWMYSGTYPRHLDCKQLKYAPDISMCNAYNDVRP